jgi:hypothetical protein
MHISIQHKYAYLRVLTLYRFLIITFIIHASLTSLTWAQNLQITEMTRGLRLEPPFEAISESRRVANTLWVGTNKGRVYRSDDAGESWVEQTVLVNRAIFLGSQYRHRFLSFEPIGILNSGILPSPGQVFSFQNMIDLHQRFPQASGQVRNYFNQGIEGNLDYLGFIKPHRSGNHSGRLANQVRRKKRWEIGVQWRSQILEKSENITKINYIANHPHNHQEVLVGTSKGLYHSTDGGDSWPLSFGGTNVNERHIEMIRFHPNNPKEIWVGTGGGLRISKDGGLTFQIPVNPLVNQGIINWIEFHPTRKGVIFVGMSWALLKSTNHGKTFGVSFIHPWPKLSNASRIFLDPARPNLILLGTLDGLMISSNLGKTFERAGGLLFVGQKIKSILYGIQPGHYLVATPHDLWQSFDYGQTWQIAYFGKIQWSISRVIPMRYQSNSFWILTQAEVLKATFNHSYSNRSNRSNQHHRLKRLIQAEPTMTMVIQSTLKRAGVHRSLRVNARKRASWRSFFPEFTASWTHRDLPINFKLNDYLISNGDMISNLNQGQFSYGVFSAFAWWELHELIFHYEELPLDAGERVAHHLESNLRTNIIHMYQERRSLLYAMVLQPKTERTRLMRMLRFEELTAHLNQMSGFMFEPFKALKTYHRPF